MAGGGGNGVIGYEFYGTVHAGLCHGPVDAVTQIKFDGETVFTGSESSGIITVDARDLFGGEELEGGVAGNISIFNGTSVQSVSSALESSRGAGEVPAYRGLTCLLLQNFYFGNNPYFKVFSATVKRILKVDGGAEQWYPEKAAIGPDDMNPIHVLYEVLTSKRIGQGIDPSELDDAGFRAAADVVYDEGIGVSFLWTSRMPIKDMINKIEQHIDGSIVPDLNTGKISVALARDDYDINTIPELGESDINAINNIKYSADSELPNTVHVGFRNRETGEDDTYTVRDASLAAVVNHATTLQFEGIRTQENAQKVGMRALKALSTPTMSCTIIATRAASGLRVNDVFKLTYPRRGINGLVMRVSSISFGTFTNSEIQIGCVQDVFAAGNAVYSVDEPAAWVGSPALPGHLIGGGIVRPSTYYELANRSGDTFAAAQTDTDHFYFAAGARSTKNTINARVYQQILADPLGPMFDTGLTVPICARGELQSGVGATSADTTFVLENVTDGHLIQVGDLAEFTTYALEESTVSEFVQILTHVDNGATHTITVKRGCIDTIPKSHPAGAALTFSGGASGGAEAERLGDPVPKYALLASNFFGTADEATSSRHIINDLSLARHFRPWAPGNVQINGSHAPGDVSGASDITATWAHRDREQLTNMILGYYDSDSVGPAPGESYIYEFRNGATIYSSGTYVTVDTAVLTPAELAGYTGPIEFVIRAHRDLTLAYSSVDQIVIPFNIV